MARVLYQTTVVRDGMHNGFTDLIFWQDSYWVSYRKGSQHVSIDGEVCVAVSTDRERFREVGRVKVPGDNRDPKLIAIDDGKLAMYFPSWIGGSEKLNLQQYVAFSNDGWNWEQPEPVYEPHWWFWRIVSQGGRYYCAAYTYIELATHPSQSNTVDFLVSDDLLHWERCSRVEGISANESALHFRDDGEVWLVSRSAVKGSPAILSVSQKPYTSWKHKPLEHMVHSPVILEHEGKVFVAGRRSAGNDGPHFPLRGPGSNANLGLWELKNEALHPLMYIPACGDCGYPGLIEDPAGRICLSYYSAHAYRMGVLPTRYRQSLDTPDGFERVQQSDVYFAEIDLS